MDFSPSEEQLMLLETTQRFLASAYGFEHRKRVLASDAGWSRDSWRQLGELGLLAVDIPEADGGIGAGPEGVALVARAMGAALVLEPFLASAVAATRAVVQLGSDAQRARWLPDMASGEQVAVLVQTRDGAADAPRASADGDGWRLDGHAALVDHAPLADLLLVAAQVDGAGGLGLFAVPAGSTGVQVHGYPTVDGRRAGDVRLDGVAVGPEARLGEGDVSAALQAIDDYALAAACAEAVGTLERVLAATIDYSRSRVQFGVAIGSFQALQHRMADMLMHVEQARSMAQLATARCQHADPAVRRAAVSGAKVLVGQAARHVGKEAVQLHGGMGMTDELDVSHCFKRLLGFELRLGTTAEHLAACRGLLQAG